MVATDPRSLELETEKLRMGQAILSIHFINNIGVIITSIIIRGVFLGDDRYILLE